MKLIQILTDDDLLAINLEFVDIKRTLLYPNGDTHVYLEKVGMQKPIIVNRNKEFQQCLVGYVKDAE